MSTPSKPLKEFSFASSSCHKSKSWHRLHPFRQTKMMTGTAYQHENDSDTGVTLLLEIQIKRLGRDITNDNLSVGLIPKKSYE
jgi:hypothetical protein